MNGHAGQQLAVPVRIRSPESDIQVDVAYQSHRRDGGSHTHVCLPIPHPYPCCRMLNHHRQRVALSSVLESSAGWADPAIRSGTVGGKFGKERRTYARTRIESWVHESTDEESTNGRIASGLHRHDDEARLCGGSSRGWPATVALFEPRGSTPGFLVGPMAAC